MGYCSGSPGTIDKMGYCTDTRLWVTVTVSQADLDRELEDYMTKYGNGNTTSSKHPKIAF